MSDLWKPGPSAEPRPPARDGGPTNGIHHPINWFEGVSAVPFIEVGGAPAASPEPPVPAPITVRAPEPEPVLKLITESLPPGLFTVRFRPVVAGHLPGRGFGPELIAFHDPDHPISEQYRLLAAEIALQLPNGPPRVLLFTGGTAEAGTTTVLLNMALTLARTGANRVTVVDANLARPAVAERLGLASGPGLCDVLAGRTPIPWAVQNTRHANLRALVAGRLTSPPDETAFPPVVDRLRSESDWVLIDAPTWTRPAESVPLADCCDALYLVTRQPDADTPQTVDLQRGFLESTGRLKGCVLTQR
jgi:Mrp family chromosome partitioning ATPase